MKMPAARRRKPKSTKILDGEIWRNGTWIVRSGALRRRQGRPNTTRPLFQAVAEKLPFECLGDVFADLAARGVTRNGIYIAHDSMGVPRYIGRGSILNRLKNRKKAQPLELIYFSFYVVSEKSHEREIETLLIRAASTQLHFNTRKKRVDIEAGSIKDYEAGTVFYERQRPRGRKRGAA